MDDRIRVLSLQAAIFVENLNLGDPLSIAQGVNSASGKIFNGAPTILPLHQKIPPNVPAILLASEDKRFSCNICLNRVDYRFAVQNEPPADIRSVWEKYYGVLRQVTEYLTRKNPTPVSRLGFVAQFFIKLGVSANRHIVANYIREGIIENPYDMNVNFLNRFALGSREVNRWIKIKPVRNAKNPGDDTAMIVEVDINTLQEKKTTFPQDDIDLFFEDAYLRILSEDIKKIILD